MKNAYPVILTRGEEFIVVYVPDCKMNTRGKDVPDAIEMAWDATGLVGIDMEDDGEPIPPASGAFHRQGCDYKSGLRRSIVMIDIDELLAGFVKRSEEIIGNNLIGIYLHGSAAMGCFHPAKSDVDLIVVVKKPLPDAVKKTYIEMVVDLNAFGPTKGIEMSVVTADVCNPFVYPTPFELHFSVTYLDWYRKSPDDYIQKMKGTDKDLAAHFTIILMRGRCLHGTPVREVFGEVPQRDYMDSIWNDIADAEESISDHAMYLILNLGRVLAFKEEGLVLSKKEGGEWAARHIPSEYAPLIKEALLEYKGNGDVAYDLCIAKKYAGYMLERIQNK